MQHQETAAWQAAEASGTDARGAVHAELRRRAALEASRRAAAAAAALEWLRSPVGPATEAYVATELDGLKAALGRLLPSKLPTAGSNLCKSGCQGDDASKLLTPCEDAVVPVPTWASHCSTDSGPAPPLPPPSLQSPGLANAAADPGFPTAEGPTNGGSADCTMLLPLPDLAKQCELGQPAPGHSGGTLTEAAGGLPVKEPAAQHDLPNVGQALHLLASQQALGEPAEVMALLEVLDALRTLGGLQPTLRLLASTGVQDAIFPLRNHPVRYSCL